MYQIEILGLLNLSPALASLSGTDCLAQGDFSVLIALERSVEVGGGEGA